MNNIRFSSRISGVFALVSLFAIFAAGCSSDDGPKCGTGTVLDKKLNRCVFDGTVVCTGNTRFDVDSGTCVADASLCAEGTVLLDGKCVSEDDALMGSVTEGAEPNDLQVEGAVGTPLALPAEGSATTFKGCVVPQDFNTDDALDPDFDDFVVTTTGPVYVEITVDGVRGLSGAFQASSTIETLVADGWSRLGLDPTSDTSSRRLFLPAAGEYVITVSDTRSFTGLVAGNAKSCYFGTLAVLPTPAAESVAVGDRKDGIFKDAGFYATTAVAGQVFAPLLGPTEARNVVGSIVVLKNGEYLTSVAAAQAGGQATSLLFGLEAGDGITFVTEYVQNVDPDEAPYAFILDDLDSRPLGATGSVSLTDNSGDTDLYPYHALYFDGTAGDVVHVSLDTDAELTAFVADSTGASAGTLCDGECPEGGAWFPIQSTGIHYVVVVGPEGVNTPYTVTYTRAAVTPAALTVGTPAAVALATNDRGFFTLDFTGTTWLEFAASNLTGLTDARVSLYPIDGVGVLDSDDLEPTLQYTVNGIETHGYVSKGDTRKFLVSVQNEDAHTGNETFSFSAAERTITNFGMRSQANPVASTAATLAANKLTYFLLTASESSRLTITVDPDGGEDVFVRRLNLDETQLDVAGDIGAGGIETLETTLTSGNVVALAVGNLGGGAGAFHIAIAIEDPPYTSAPGALAYTDACTGGTVLLDATDTALLSESVALDTFSFSYFGDAVTTMFVGADGWLTFDGTYAGDGNESPGETFPDPEGEVHGILAPYWNYLASPTVCVKKSATAVTIQWEGQDLFGSFFGEDIPIRVQAVLHDNGTIDYIYGADHTPNEGAVGLDNLDGSLGLKYGSDPAAGTSVTWTPSAL